MAIASSVFTLAAFSKARRHGKTSNRSRLVNESERPANTSRIIGLVASFFGGAFLLLAYLMAFEDYVAWMVGITGGIGMLGCYVAFCCGRMGTSNFKNLD